MTPPSSFPDSTIEFTDPPRQVGPRFTVYVTGGDALSVIFRGDPTLVSKSQLVTLFTWIEDELVRLAADSSGLVGDAAERPIATVTSQAAVEFA